MIGWSQTRDDIIAALSGLRKATINAEEDVEMNLGEIVVENDSKVQDSSDCSTDWMIHLLLQAEETHFHVDDAGIWHLRKY